MAIIVGSGEHRYEVIENWGKLPDGWRYGEVAAVGVDSKDNVYVFARSEHPMMVFDRDGNFLRSWGEGLFRRPHGVHLAPDARGEAAAGYRRARRASADVRRRSVQPLHAYRAIAGRRSICLRRLRQRARAQVLAEWKVAVLLGRAWHRSGRVQHRAQHLLRRGR